MDDDESPSVGYKKLGHMSEAQRKMRNASIDAIKREWNVENVIDVFPAAIRPTSDDALGNTSISNIKSISTRVQKSTAKDLFAAECGNEIVSFRHTARILKALGNVKSKTSAGKGSGLKKRSGLDDHDDSPPPFKKTLVDKYPTPRIPKRTAIINDATSINNPSNAGLKNASESVDFTNDDLQPPTAKSATNSAFNQTKPTPSPRITPNPYAAQHNNQLSVEDEPTAAMTSKEPLGTVKLVEKHTEAQEKAVVGGNKMTQDEKIAKIQKLLEERKQRKEIEAQKFRALVENSPIPPSVSTPCSCTQKLALEDADAGRAVKAQSEGLITTKPPLEETSDTMIVDTKKRKAFSVPLELKHPSSPSVAPIAPIMDAVTSVSKLKSVNTVPESKKPLSYQIKAPMAPMHTVPTPTKLAKDAPSSDPSHPVKGLSTKKTVSGDFQLATSLEKSTSKAAQQANTGIRAIGKGVTIIKKIGDDKGQVVMQELADLVTRNAARLNADVQAFYEKHGLSVESGS